MAELFEKQFELGGVVFGAGAPVEIISWTPGTPAARTQDVDNPVGDGIRMGRDTRGSATWTFSMYTNAESEEEAWETLAALAAAWDADEVRQEAGEVVPLRYCLAGQTRVIYGRPRRWSIVPTNMSLSGRIDIEADFATVDHRIYDDVLHTLPVTLTPPLEVDAGFLVPFTPPFTTSAGSSQRESQVTIGGTVPTPIMVTFSGGSNVAVRIGGWTAALVDPVLTTDPVTVDGRPWVRAATYMSGASARVSPRVTKISKMWLPPGTHEVVFTGTDPAGSASVLVSWRNANRTPR